MILELRLTRGCAFSLLYTSSYVCRIWIQSLSDMNSISLCASMDHMWKRVLKIIVYIYIESKYYKFKLLRKLVVQHIKHNFKFDILLNFVRSKQ